MENFNPTYSLTEFKNSDFEITKTAQETASALDFNDEGTVKVADERLRFSLNFMRR